MGLNHIEKSKDKWIDKSKITSQNVLAIAGALVDVYVIFLTAFIPLDNILNNQKLMRIPDQLFNLFWNKDAFVIIVKNLLDRSSQMGILLITLPGADCYQVGFRMGVFERFLYGIKYE